MVCVCFSFQPTGFDWFSKKGLTSFYVIFNTGAHQYCSNSHESAINRAINVTIKITRH